MLSENVCMCALYEINSPFFKRPFPWRTALTSVHFLLDISVRVPLSKGNEVSISPFRLTLQTAQVNSQHWGSERYETERLNVNSECRGCLLKIRKGSFVKSAAKEVKANYNDVLSLAEIYTSLE